MFSFRTILLALVGLLIVATRLWCSYVTLAQQ